jgi:hypothetical protein
MGEAIFPRVRSRGSYTIARVTSYLSRWLMFFLLNWAVIATAANGTQLEIPARYLGSASCSSSSCHGGAGERHNQFIIWSQRDFHTKAFLILTTARSTQIARSLGIQSAERSSRCTVCHSPLATVAQSRLVPPEQHAQGVACESCHGPAESWLRSHTRRDYTYAMRVGSGMRDLRNIYVRANACVACHQVVDPQITASGHPPLFFELATQMKFEPPHWRELGEPPVKTWLAGQASALRELSWNGGVGYKSDSVGDASPQRAGLAWLLAKVTAADSSLPKILEDGNISMMQQTADELARSASARDFDHSYALKIVRVLASAGNDFTGVGSSSQDVLYYRAKRLVLALQALISGDDSIADSSELRQLIADVTSLSGFEPKLFVQHLESFRLSLEAAHR